MKQENNENGAINFNYKKEYRKYLTAATLDNANNKIAGHSLLVAFAVYLGISDFWIGIYTVLDTITNMIQIIAAPLFSRIGQSKKVVLTNYSIYRISSVLPAIIPFLTQDITVRTILFFICATIYAITGELGYITFINWRMSLLKKEDRAKFAATKNMLKNTIVVAFSFGMGIVLDQFTKQGNELWGFIILFVIITIVAFLDITIRAFTINPNIEEPVVTIKETVRMPETDKKFRPILLIGGVYRLAIGIGTMYLNLYLLRYLNINYFYYAILNLILYLSEASGGILWSKIYQKKKSWKRVIFPMSILYGIIFLLLTITNHNIILYIVPIIYILLGTANSAYDLFDNIAIYENSKVGYQTSYVTFEKFIEGIITTVIPVLSLTLLTEKGGISNIKLTFLIATFLFIILFFIYQKQNKKIE